MTQQASVNQGDILNLSVPITSYEEQTRVVEEIESSFSASSGTALLILISLIFFLFLHFTNFYNL